MPRLVKICQKIIEYSFYLLFFLVPLIMTPWNYELFEFNKMLAVYFFTIFIVAAWLIKMVIAKKFLFKKTFWDIPLAIFFISQLISSTLSIDHHTSLWGYYSRFNGGLISIISYLLLYWAFVSNMDKRKTLCSISYVLCSAALVAAYGIAEHFGIDAKAWVQDVQNRVFSTLGQPNWLAAWLVALIPIPMAMSLNFQAPSTKLQTNNKHQAPNYKNFGYLNFKNWNLFGIWNLLIGYFLFAILFLCLLYTKSRSGILGFGVAFVIFWGLVFIISFTKRQKNYTLYPIPYTLKSFIIFTFLILLLTFLIPTPWQPKFLRFKSEVSQPTTVAQEIPTGVTESGEIRKIVWKGALEIWKHHPVFGTGVETFAYSYYWYRPREHNDVSEWDFLYNKAHNEYLNYMATTGTVGLLAYLGLIGMFVIWSLRRIFNFKFKNFQSISNSLISKQKKIKNLIIENSLEIKNYKIENLLLISLLSGFTSILITNFFGFSVVAVNLLFFLFPAMSITSSRVKEQESERVENQSAIHPWQLAIIFLILLSTIYYLLSTIRYWYADTRFALGEKLSKGNQADQAFTDLQKAVKIRPEPIYLDELGITTASLAVSAFQQQESTLSSQLVDLAIKQSDWALKISPYNVNFWKNRTRLFYALAEIDSQYNQEALKSLLLASELAPTDAKIAYNLGLLYSKFGQDETALKIGRASCRERV